MIASYEPIVAFSIPGGPEWILILVVALLIFGRRLPDVARSVGKSIVEFKKGLKDMKDNIGSDDADRSSADVSHSQNPRLTQGSDAGAHTKSPAGTNATEQEEARAGGKS